MTSAPSTITLWPRWMESAGAMQAIGAHVRSCCCQCRTVQRVSLADLIACHGPAWSLIDAIARCTIVGCVGSVYYLTTRAYDRPWTPMVRDPELVETVVAYRPVAHAGP